MIGRKKRSAVVIAGYYGFGNTGDELILSAMLQRLRQEHPGRSVTVLSGNPEKTAEHHDVKSVNRWKPWEWLSPMWNAETFILGGGGLLQEFTGTWNHLYYLFLVVLAKCLGCRTEIRAIGVDVISHWANRVWTRFVFNNFVNYASVRDSDSQRALEMIGVVIRLWRTPDLVFNLERPKNASATKPAKPRIAWVLADWPQRPGWDQDLAYLIQRVGRELQVENDLISFFPEQDDHTNQMVGRVASPAPTLRTWTRADELPAMFMEYDLVIGMRYHALVLAAVAEKPFIGWGYQQKIHTLCRDFNQPLWTFERGWDHESVFRQIADAWKRRQTLPERYRKQIAHLLHAPAEATETARIFVALA